MRELQRMGKEQEQLQLEGHISQSIYSPLKKEREKEKRIHSRPKAQTGSHHTLQSRGAVNIPRCLNTSKA